jgi:uncharacterized protein
MVIAANAAVGKAWAHHATGILCGLLAGAMFLFGAIDYATGGGAASPDHNPAPVDFAIMATALLAAAVASKPVREWIARFIPVDPDSPVHSLALALAVILFGTQLASVAFTDVLATEQQSAPLGIPDLLGQEVPFLVLALVGVGIFQRRNTTDSGARLGFVTPAWWHVALAIAAAGVFFAVSNGADSLSHALTPSVAQRVDQTTQHLFGGLGDPAGLIALALIPGICEEALFRGALQPRFGIVVTALLFTSIHAEYGLSLDVPTIFVISLGLGFIRKYTNTTTSAACHVAYNLLVGFGLTGAALYGGIAVEVALAGLVVYVIWSRRRQAAVNKVAVEETRVG